MKLIMKYFSFEGRFSCLYAYHIRLLMHFTRVWMMNLPFFICGNIERMKNFMQQKTPQQQLNSFITFLLSGFWWIISGDYRSLLGRTSSPVTSSALHR